MRKALFIALISFLPLVCKADEVRVIVLRAQFSDCGFTLSEEEVEASIARCGDYFNDQFLGDKSFVFDVGPVVELPEDTGYYGRNSSSGKDEFIYKAVMTACTSSAGGIDFSAYDNNGDGVVDNVHILFAGHSESAGFGEDRIFPQQNYLSGWSQSLILNGKRINSFSTSCEYDGTGTICHEYAHSIGLVDLYDTDGEGSGGTAPALWGSTALMDRGNLNDGGNTPPNLNAIDLELLGIGMPEPLAPGHYTLEPVNAGHRYLKALTDSDGEYYLFECRKADGWDRFIGGEGLLIYHIDKSSSPAGWSDYYQDILSASERWSCGEVNCRPDRQCAELVAADPLSSVAADVFFPSKAGGSFGSDTRPAFRFVDGKASNLALTGIRRNADGSVSFNVTEPITVTGITVFQDAVIVDWEIDSEVGDADRFEISLGDGTAARRASGQARSFTVEGLQPGTGYVVELSLVLKNGDRFSTCAEFRTKVSRDDVNPYIYLSSAARNQDGSFTVGSKIPLRVFNAPDAVEVIWTLNGKTVRPGADGWYTLSGSGKLRAEIKYADGSRDIIIKELTVR